MCSRGPGEVAVNDRSHEGRLSGLEKGYESLQGEIHGLRTDLRALAAEIRTELGTARRVQWSPLIAGLAVLVAIIGGLASGPIADIERIEERLNRTESNRFTDRDGGRLEGRVDRVEQRLDMALDEDFKRPEAEAMRSEIMAEIRRLQDRLENP